MSGSDGTTGPYLQKDVWIELDENEESAAWKMFDARFAFSPNPFDQTPSIDYDDECLVLDLSPVSDGRRAAGADAINASALRAFVWLTVDASSPHGSDLIALDWQHPAYRYSPMKHSQSIDREPLAPNPLEVPVFPDGDYYIHMAPDRSWGTFGHPWQRSLTIWGQPLLNSLGVELLTWLPRHPHSRL